MAKPLYDALHSIGQPDLRKKGLVPIYDCGDDVINRATYVGESSYLGRDAAWRRVARAAMGVEADIQQHAYRRQPAYHGEPQFVSLDLEDPRLLDLLDAESATSADRAKGIDWLCRCIDAMRDEAANYGRTIAVGAYCPLFPFGESLASWDPRNAGLMFMAERDFAPLLKRYDFFAPDCYVHGMDRHEADVRREIDTANRLDPNKPLLPYLNPCFGWAAVAEKRGELMPLADFKKAAKFILSQPEVDGMGLWGGTKKNNVDRFQWAELEPYVSAAAEIAKRS